MSSGPINGDRLAVYPVSPVAAIPAESALAAVALPRQLYRAQIQTAAPAPTNNYSMTLPGLGENIDQAAFSRES